MIGFIFVICNKVHRQLCLFFGTMTIVFTFLYVVFYNCHNAVGLLKGEEHVD
jgi:hypothetical protein